MKNVERRDRQLPYISDAEVMEQQMNARRLTQKLNTIDRSDFDGIAAIVKELFGKSEGAFVNPPFYCDYGFHIEVGKNFFANYNCTILDVAKVKIGDNCQMAPNVAIYTAHKVLHGQPHQTQPGAGRGHRALLRRCHGGRDAGGDEGDDNSASSFAGGEPRQALGGADRDARRGQV